MSVTLSEVKRAAKAHRAPLAGESAGYLVLAIADQVLCAPRMVQGNDVQLTADGGLRVLSGRASSDAEAELSLRRALDSLLLVASSGSAALTRASRRTSPVGLSGLVRELETALIPVNRAAARRALARIHRETARALTSGLLLEEEVEAALPMAAVAPVSAAVSAVEVAKAPVLAVAASPVLTAESMPIVRMSAELAALDESEALTVALEARSLDDADVALDFDVDVVFEELEPLAADSSAAPTVMHARVAPIPDLIVAELPRAREPLVDMPVEACTRPEPVVLRKSLCAELTEVAPRVVSEPCPPVSECLSRTPTRGSLAAHLPVLVPERIAVVSAARAAPAEPVSACLAQPEPSVNERAVGSEQPLNPDLVICSVPVEDCTEQMPEVMPLVPGVAIIATRKSNVSDLLSCFQVAADDSNRGLCRAIKELAGLDLTPAPFAALIR